MPQTMMVKTPISVSATDICMFGKPPPALLPSPVPKASPKTLSSTLLVFDFLSVAPEYRRCGDPCCLLPLGGAGARCPEMGCPEMGSTAWQSQERHESASTASATSSGADAC